MLPRGVMGSDVIDELVNLSKERESLCEGGVQLVVDEGGGANKTPKRFDAFVGAWHFG